MQIKPLKTGLEAFVVGKVASMYYMAYFEWRSA